MSRIYVLVVDEMSVDESAPDFEKLDEENDEEDKEKGLCKSTVMFSCQEFMSL